MEAAQLQAHLEKRLIRQWEPIPGSLQIREAPEGVNSPGIVYGPVLVYGDRAKVYDFEEEILAGAFGDVEKLDLRANYMHQRQQPLGRTTGKAPGLTMKSDEKQLTAELILPPHHTRG